MPQESFLHADGEADEIDHVSSTKLPRCSPLCVTSRQGQQFAISLMFSQALLWIHPCAQLLHRVQARLLLWHNCGLMRRLHCWMNLGSLPQMHLFSNSSLRNVHRLINLCLKGPLAWIQKQELTFLAVLYPMSSLGIYMASNNIMFGTNKNPFTLKIADLRQRWSQHSQTRASKNLQLICD